MNIISSTLLRGVVAGTPVAVIEKMIANMPEQQRAEASIQALKQVMSSISRGQTGELRHREVGEFVLWCSKHPEYFDTVNGRKTICDAISVLASSKDPMARRAIYQVLTNFKIPKNEWKGSVFEKLSFVPAYNSKDNYSARLTATIFASPATPKEFVRKVEPVLNPDNANDYRAYSDFYQSLLMNAMEGDIFGNIFAFRAFVNARQNKSEDLKTIISKNDSVDSGLFLETVLTPKKEGASSGLYRLIQQKATSGSPPSPNKMSNAAIENLVIEQYPGAIKSGKNFTEAEKKYLNKCMMELFKRPNADDMAKLVLLNQIVNSSKNNGSNYPISPDDIFDIGKTLMGQDPDKYASVFASIASQDINLDTARFLLRNIFSNKRFCNQNMTAIAEILKKHGLVNDPIAAPDEQWNNKAFPKETGNFKPKPTLPQFTQLPIDHTTDTKGLEGLDEELTAQTWYGLTKQAGMFDLSNEHKTILLALMVMFDAAVWTVIGRSKQQELQNDPAAVNQATEIVQRVQSGKSSEADRQMVLKARQAVQAVKSTPAAKSTPVVKSTPAPKQSGVFLPVTITDKEVQAIIDVEGTPASGTSHKGAAGVMQIMPDTWQYINEKSFGNKYPFSTYKFNPTINKAFGKEYLNMLVKLTNKDRNKWKANQFYLVAAAYNGGLARIQRMNYDPATIAKMYPGVHDYAIRACNIAGIEPFPKK